MSEWGGDDKATAGQKAAIATVLNVHGIRDRSDRLALLSWCTGWEVESMNHLAQREASYCLDHIHNLIDAGELDAALVQARATAATRKALT